MEEAYFYDIYNPIWRRWVQINLLDEPAPISGYVSVGGEVAEETPASNLSKSPKKQFSTKLARILAAIGVILLAIYFVPGLIADINLSRSEAERLTKAGETSVGRTLPRFDPTLPKANHLNIPSIGVDGNIEESTYDNYESALKKGVWRVSDFGEPDIKGAPVILAAHRYGYLAWNNTFRRKNSFYNLPKVKVGDVITIAWEQRLYTYGVYKTENGSEISDYSADLILYTCVELSGPERIFVYARAI